MGRRAVTVLGMLLLAHAAAAQFTQQGNKLVGTGVVGNLWQGGSVALSADGNTAIVGGSGNSGAAWVFTRSGGVWSQQGNKLVGTGAVGAAQQGVSVALSADGNTALVGGSRDNSNAGAAWVFTRSGGVWSQQGNKLVGTGAVGAASQGGSVALSADGNTAIVGGPQDNSWTGAVWVFTRSGGVWSQEGSKLVGTGAVGAAEQGGSVAISADGNTAIVSGLTDNSNTGAVWVFTRSGGVWSQQGSKLVATDAVGAGMQGFSVALSADGNTALVGGPQDNSQVGAVWEFTRSGGVWSQQGNKLVGAGSVGPALQGQSVAISADGNTAIVGGWADNSTDGAVWEFTRSGGVWSQQGSKLVGTGAVGDAWQGFSVALSADGNTALIGGPQDNSQVGAAWVFVSSGGCTPPSITSQPQSESIQSGQTATLSVTATGTTPLYYEWYQGPSGNTSNAVGTNSNAFTTPALTTTTSYWVRVFNACGQVDSATATVSMCTQVSITTQPESQGIKNGQTATLSVTAAGTTPLSYQWYQGTSGDTSQPVGTNARTFTTPALTTTTRYWVRVANACSHADSATATVVTCVSITIQPQSQSIQSGQTAYLFVGATGTTPLYYQWYQGVSGDTPQPVGTNASSFTTPALTATTSYWVRVFNACSHADSATATVTVRNRLRRHLWRVT